MPEKDRPRGGQKPGISGVPEGLDARLSDLEARIEMLTSALKASVAPPAQQPISSRLTNLLQGVTILAIISFAFWLGGLSNKIDDHTAKIDKVVAWKDDTSARLSVIETKLSAIEKKLDDIDRKLDAARR